MGNEYNMEFFIKMDREFHEMMTKSKEIREFIHKEYPDNTDEEQMDIYRALLAESMKKDKINLSDLEYVYGDHALTKKFNDLHNRLEETRKSVISQHPNLSIDDQEDLVATLFQSSYLIDKEKTVEKQHNEVQAELERKVEEIPIEEFDNDTQDYREEYLKKFGK